MLSHQLPAVETTRADTLLVLTYSILLQPGPDLSAAPYCCLPFGPTSLAVFKQALLGESTGDVLSTCCSLDAAHFCAWRSS